MGYKNKIRVMLPEAEFIVMDSKIKELNDDGFFGYDIKKYRIEDPESVKKEVPQREPVRYVYFGWDWIIWDDEIEGFEAIIMDAVYESESCHFIRCGEEITDIDIFCSLTGYVDHICFCRTFNDIDGFESEEHKNTKNKYVVCMHFSYVRDSQMFYTVDMSQEEFDHKDMYGSKSEDRWYDMEPTPFIAVVDAETEDEACEIAAEQCRYDKRCLFATKIEGGAKL